MVARKYGSYYNYAVQVVERRLPVCRFIRLACKRFLSDLEKAGERDLAFDAAAANHALLFIERLRHSKGEWRGQRLILSDWQRFIIANLFGWLRKSTGFRRFKRFYVEIPRKNGKSTLAAAIALYLFVADGEGAPEVYVVANALPQVIKTIFAECKRMVLQSPELSKRIVPYRAELIIDNKDATLQPLHSESKNLDGLNTHGAVVDEYHEATTSDHYDKIRTSTGSRRQSLVGIITTAGKDIAGPCYKERGESINVLEGVGTPDDSMFAFIATVDDGDDWRDETTWAKANPNLGVSVLLEKMREDLASAQNSPHKEADFKRYHLNIWTNEESRWISIDVWRRCKSDPITPEAFAGRECIVGMDLSSNIDLTATAYVFPDSWAAYLRFFMPRDHIVEASNRDHVDYASWVRSGFMVATPGNIIDTDFIRQDINRLSEIFTIREIAFDPKFATTIVTQLMSDGFDLVKVSQTTTGLNAACSEFEKLLLAARFWHGGNPVLEWNANNVVVVKDLNGAVCPAKGRSFARIDGISAIVTAMARVIVLSDPEAAPAISFL